MSNLESCVGEVVLPSSDVATIKRLFRTRHNDMIMKSYDMLKSFRIKNPTSSAARWRAALAEYENGLDKTPEAYVALKIAYSITTPKAVKWEDFIAQGFGKAGVSEDKFNLFGPDGTIVGQVRFFGRTIRWEIFEGNHAVDDFNDSKDHEFLHKVLESVVWIRGTGGGETTWSEKNPNGEITARFGSTGKRYKKPLKL